MAEKKSRLRDLAQQRFGRLVALSVHPERRNKCVLWLCHCDCGQEALIRAAVLLSGATNSCGCLRSENSAALGPSRKTHGDATLGAITPEYKSWSSFRNRCENPRNIAYPNYGGQGIAVCARWASYEAFLTDMGRRPSPEHSLDRIDNNGPYAPENCRWATRTEQSNNRRPPRAKTTTRLITLRGETKTVAQWARDLGISSGALHQRLKGGMKIEEALRAQPLRRGRQTSRFVTLQGETKTLELWAKELGVPISTVYQRIASGWPEDEALTTPPGKMPPFKRLRNQTQTSTLPLPNAKKEDI